MQWEFNEDVKCNSEEFWYDLTEGGYINPAELLSDKTQVMALKGAIGFVKSFQDAYESLGFEGDEEE